MRPVSTNGSSRWSTARWTSAWCPSLWPRATGYSSATVTNSSRASAHSTGRSTLILSGFARIPNCSDRRSRGTRAGDEPAACSAGRNSRKESVGWDRSPAVVSSRRPCTGSSSSPAGEPQAGDSDSYLAPSASDSLWRSGWPFWRSASETRRSSSVSAPHHFSSRRSPIPKSRPTPSAACCLPCEPSRSRRPTRQPPVCSVPWRHLGFERGSRAPRPGQEVG